MRELLLFVSLIACVIVLAQADKEQECKYEMVESMPEKFDLPDVASFKPRPTHETLLELIDTSDKTLRIASFYWFLSAEEQFVSHPSAVPGKQIMDSIEAASKRGVNVQIMLDNSTSNIMSNPTDLVKLKQIATLKFLNMTKLLGAGVLHTKFLIADNQSFYVGSSNFDWRSYTQIKEIGLSVVDCGPLAQDLDKIFRTYVMMSESVGVPWLLPVDLKTSINSANPLRVNLVPKSLAVTREIVQTSDQPTSLANVFLAASPPPFNGVHNWTGRTDDIDGLLHVINTARHSIDISVMNYSPMMEFGWPKRYWPRIDDALRRAAFERHVRVRLLFSQWSHVKPLELVAYKSLNAIQSKQLRGGGIHVKMFTVPASDDFEKSIPYARVKHDKYMVTERSLYIGTSNWSADYFINTCGVSVVIEPANATTHQGNTTQPLLVVKNMRDLFDRDFESPHAKELDL